MRKVGAWRSLSDGGIPLGRLPRQQAEQAERVGALLPRFSGAVGVDLSGLGAGAPLPRQHAERAERVGAPLPRPSGAVGAPFPRLSGAAGADLSGLAETMVEQAERAGASLPRFSGLAKTIVEQAEQVEPAEQATRAGAPIAVSPSGGRRRAESPRRSVLQRLHNVQQ